MLNRIRWCSPPGRDAGDGAQPAAVRQLDGGHSPHAVFNRRSTLISLVTIVCVATMSAVTKSWIATTVIMLLMLLLVGPSIRGCDEDEPLGAGRRALAVFALVMLVVLHDPDPITIVGP